MERKAGFFRSSENFGGAAVLLQGSSSELFGCGVLQCQMKG